MGRAAPALVTLVVALVAVISGRDATAQPRDDVGLTLRSQTFAVEPDGTWVAHLGVADPGGGLVAATAAATSTTTTTTTSPTSPTSPVPSTATTGPVAVDGEVLVRVYEPVTTRAQIADVLDGDLPPRLDAETIELADTTVSVADDEHVTVRLDVPTATDRGPGSLTLTEPGIYPVTITLTLDGTPVGTHQTFLRRLADTDDRDAPPLNVAVVAALADPGPNPAGADRAAHRTALEQLAEYGSITDAPLTLALPPSLDIILDADELLRAEVADALGHTELLALPHLTLDPSAAIDAGQSRRFASELRDGEDVLTRLFPGIEVRRGGWIVQAPLTGAAAATLRDPLGFRLLLFDGATYDELPGSIGGYLDTQRLVAASPGGGEQDLAAAVVARESGLLATPTDTGTRVDVAVELLARLLVTRDELGADDRRTTVLALDGFALPDAPIVDALFELVTQQPDVRLITLSEVAGRTDYMRVDEDITTVDLPTETGVDLTERLARIELVRVSTEAAASMLPTDERRLAWQNDLDRLISTGLSDDEVDASLERISGQVDDVLGSVELPEGFSFTLTGRHSPLRLNVHNTADETRTVRIHPSSPKLRFPDGDQLVVLEPGINEIVIPVEARANGTSAVEVSLRTPVFDRALGPPIVLEARVNAITGLGPMFTGAAIVLLVSWWFNHYRRRRRSSTDDDDTPPQGVSSSGTGTSDTVSPETVSPDAAAASVAPAERRPGPG
ncbi:MAG: hypothetical protein ACK5OX_16225 [Desertimonas sp.]